MREAALVAAVMVAWTLAVWFTAYTIQLRGVEMIGQDAHAYWNAWQGDWRTGMYDTTPGRLDAYNYSPTFALLIWPLAQLPWPLFGLLVSLGAAMALWHLLRPLPWWWAVPALVMCVTEVLAGNVFWVLALIAAYGLNAQKPLHASAWSFTLLTKLTPALGPVWFAARREWRPLAASVAATVLVVAATELALPGMWREWVTFLADSREATDAPEFVDTALELRIALGLLLVVVGALTDRVWTVPVAMVVVVPVWGPAALTMLAAIPRLVARRRDAQRAEGMSSTDVSCNALARSPRTLS